MRAIVVWMLLASSAALAQPDLKTQDRHPAYADEPTPKSVRTIPISPAHTFEERWEPVRELLEQQQRRKAMMEPSPEQIQPSPPLRGSVTPAPRARPLVTAAAAGDICTRHNLRKVWQGRSWRCRR